MTDLTSDFCRPQKVGIIRQENKPLVWGEIKNGSGCSSYYTPSTPIPSCKTSPSKNKTVLSVISAAG